ncbi:hypothetical protein OIO90_004265 [Microbotryomycetes sp. JL221]|nr:hypothetical protein OIO90_004265 [Microbotryomycetes sp. JL221]
MDDDGSVKRQRHDEQDTSQQRKKFKPTVGSIKLPVVNEFETLHQVENAIDSRQHDAQYVTAALTMFDKRLRQTLHTTTGYRITNNVIVDYINQDQECRLVFQAWELANKTNNSQLSTACLNCFSSILRYQSLNPFDQSDSPLIKRLLSTTSSSSSSTYDQNMMMMNSTKDSSSHYLERAFNPGRNDVTTASLKLCNVIVGFKSGRFAKKLFNNLSFNPKTTTRLFKTRLRDSSRDVLQKPDIRTLLQGLILGFLSTTDSKLKTLIVETRGLLSGLLKGLKDDHETIVNHVLNVIWKDLLNDRKVNLEVRTKVVDETFVNELIKLYDKPVTEADEELDQHVSTSVHRFLYVITDWLANQIDSTTSSYKVNNLSGGPRIGGGSSSLAMKSLSIVLKSLKVTEDSQQRALALFILERVPALTGQFWSKFPSSLDPRLSSRWISAITFATRVVSLPSPLATVVSRLDHPTTTSTTTSSLSTTLSPPTLTSLTDTCFPPNLSKQWFSKSLQHENELVRFLSSILLIAGLQKMICLFEEIMLIAQTLEEQQGQVQVDNVYSVGETGNVGRWTMLGIRLREWLKTSIVPDAQIMVALMSSSTTSSLSSSKTNTSNSDKTSSSSSKNKQSKKDQNQKSIQNDHQQHHLMTNVALRLLWLYHRAVPVLIQTLKFDFGKLPLMHASSSSTLTQQQRQHQGVEQDDIQEVVDKVDESVEGVRAINASYALRLSNVHSQSLTLSKPAEHFKTILLPLFELDQTRLTRSNRSLLRSNLSRLLLTPLLFGQDIDSQQEQKQQDHVKQQRSNHFVNVWMQSLPEPEDDTVDEDNNTNISTTTKPNQQILKLFEQSVQTTLNLPINTKIGTTSTHPLLLTVLKMYSNVIQDENQDQQFKLSLTNFLKRLFVGFVGVLKNRSQLDQIFETFKTKLDHVNNEEFRIVEFVKECEKSLSGSIQVKRSKQLLSDWNGASIVQSNVFETIANDNEELERALQMMPIELVCLHLSSNHVLIDSNCSILIKRISEDERAASAIQVLVHRIMSGSFGFDQEFKHLALMVVNVVKNIKDAHTIDHIKHVLFDQESLLKLVQTDTKSEKSISKTVIHLLTEILNSNDKRDLSLAEPFCQLVIPLIDKQSPSISPSNKKDKKRKRSSDVVNVESNELEWTTPLLPFLDESTSFKLLDILLNQIAKVDIKNSTRKQIELIKNLNEALSRVSQMNNVDLVNRLWSNHFVTLNQLDLAVQSALYDEQISSAAGSILIKAAQSLVPFRLIESSQDELDQPCFNKDQEKFWRPYVPEWTSNLLSFIPQVLSLNESCSSMIMLSALVYRSSEAREVLIEWLKQETNKEHVFAVREAVLTLTRVGQSKREMLVPNSSVTSLLSVAFDRASRDLTAREANVVTEVIRITVSLQNDETIQTLHQLLQDRLSILGRDQFTAFDLRLIINLVIQDCDKFVQIGEKFLNGSLEGLTRRLAEDPILSQQTLDMIEATSQAARSGKFEFKGHLLDTLVTAAIQFKLAHKTVVDMTARLVAAHKWKDTEITRHLNAVFANANLSKLDSASGDAYDLQQATIELILALSNSSLQSAAANRIIDKLVPLYGGTMSVLDRQMLRLFQRVELVSGSSIAFALRAWSPGSDALSTTPLDGHGVTTLSALIESPLRQCCVRICASSRMVFTPEQDSNAYDPDFLLPLISSVVLYEELRVHDWVVLLESGALSLPVAALASSNDQTRLLARATLARAINKLEALQQLKERDELMLVLTQTRHCVFSPSAEPIPSIIALFLCETLATLGRPASPFYPMLVRFLLQRSTLDQKDVPMLYQMIYSTTDQPFEDRIWILNLIEKGLMRSQDWKILRRRQTFELLASLFESSKKAMVQHGSVFVGNRAKAQDENIRHAVLKVFVKASLIPQAARELLSRNGIMAWLATQTFLLGHETSLALQIMRNLSAQVSDGKAMAIADSLDSMSTICHRLREFSRNDLETICEAVTTLVSKLPRTNKESNSSIQITFDRSRSLLNLVKSNSMNKLPKKAFYEAVMVHQFLQNETGSKSNDVKVDRELFSFAVRTRLRDSVAKKDEGMAALQRQVISTLSE